MSIVTVSLGDKLVFIINTYIPPSNSKSNKNSNCSSKNFDTLHQAVSNIREYEAGSILLCGDFNARIGCTQEFTDYKFNVNFIPCTTGSDRFLRALSCAYPAPPYFVHPSYCATRCFSPCNAILLCFLLAAVLS